MKILIVEDSITDRTLIAGVLDGQGTIDEAQAGDRALELFQEAINEKEPYDVVCLDLELPNTNGHSVLNAMRALEKHSNNRAVIIITSGARDMKHVLRATHNGCDGYVIKPISSERLLHELHIRGLPVKWDAKGARHSM